MRRFIPGTVLLVLALPSTGFGQAVRQLDLVARHIVYDRASQRLIASVARPEAYGDSIAVIDPRSGVVERYVSVGATPNRLALSDDGRFLYVGLDGEFAVRRVDLPTLTPGERFSLADPRRGSDSYAIDLAVLPGAADSFAVVWGTPQVSGPLGIAVFDGANRRPRVFEGYVGRIAFGSSASELLGTDGYAPSLYRMAVDGDGVRLVDQTRYMGGATTLLYTNGRLYTGHGVVIDPARRAIAGVFERIGFASSFCMALDPEGDRAYLVDEMEDALRIYDPRTFAYRGALPLAPVSTYYYSSSMVAWGPGQIAIQSEAGLQLVDVNGLQRLVVSKNGTGDGTVSTGPAGIDCGIECAWLYPRDEAVTLTVRPTPNSRFVGWSGDDDCSDGVVSMSSERSCVAEFAERSSGLGSTVPLAANDLAYSSSTNMLYAAVPGRDPVRGNTLTEIDPETGALGRSVWVGSDPSKLELASDGRSLYVSVEARGTLRRVDLETMTAGPAWDLGLVESGVTFHAGTDDFAVVPGDPDMVVVARGFGSLGVYRNGMLLPRTGFVMADRVELSETGTRAYVDTSVELGRWEVGSDGVTLLDETYGLGGDGSPAVFAGGRLYYGTGKVVDPEGLRVVGHLPLPQPPPWSWRVLAPDVPHGVVHAVFGWEGGIGLARYDAATLALRDTTLLPRPGDGPRPTRAVATGPGRLAFLTAEERPVLFRYGTAVTHLVSVATKDGAPVAVAIAPPDLEGRASATTPFERRYADGRAVTLAAPASLGEQVFVRWERVDGWPTAVSTNPTLTFRAVESMSFAALYLYPRPSIGPTAPLLVPAAVRAGSGTFTLTVNGSGFVSGSVVSWHGVNRPTTYVSPTRLTAAIPASDVETAGRFWIYVLSPAPGGGYSNRVPFWVTRTSAPADDDGDGLADPTVWRPRNGTWYVKHSNAGYTTSRYMQWGASGDRPVPGDYDGDRRTDLAVWRPRTGTWYIRTSSSGFSASIQVRLGSGALNDVPVPGDYDGDGRFDVAVWRPGNGIWYIKKSTTGYAAVQQVRWGLGSRGDQPAPADYDGDGMLDPCVWRRGDGIWRILHSGSGYATSRQVRWGRASMNDKLVPADYDGDGRADIAVWRPSSGNWYICRSATNYATSWQVQWGQGAKSDKPVPADYDGDGHVDLAVWRPINGVWYIKESSTGYTTSRQVPWGSSTDVPLATR